MKNLLMVVFIGLAGMVLGSEPYVLYVSPTGDDSNAGLSEQSPLRTINKAVGMLEAQSDIDDVGGKVYLLDGTYSEEVSQYPLTDNLSNTAVVVTHPISVEGFSKDASKVKVKKLDNKVVYRQFLLNHPQSAIRYLTLESGDAGKNPGGGVYIGENGGSVEDCLIVNCRAGNVSGQPGGGGCYMMAGRLLRTKVYKCNVNNMRRYGAGIYAAGGVIDNCLITECKTSHHASSCNGNAAVCLVGKAKMVNSTVVKNTSCLVTGVWIGSSTAQAVNCAVYGNNLCASTHSEGVTRYNGCFVNLDVGNTTVKPTHATGKGDLFIACASESDPYTESCIKLLESPFTDFDKSDYTHSLESVLANKGDSPLARSNSVSAMDLFGGERYSGGSVDIGAYEVQQGFSVGFTADATKFVLPGESTVTFITEVSGSSGAVTYTWDFGDGTALLETTESNVAHEYNAPGHYKVTLSATDGIHSAEYILPKTIDVYAMSFEAKSTAVAVVTNMPARFVISDVSTDELVTYIWNFGDGTTLSTDVTELEHIYSTPGNYRISISGRTDSGKTYALEDYITMRVITRDLYADASNSNSAQPYDSWQNASRSIKTLVEYAADGCVIHVKTGTYNLDKGTQIKIEKALVIIGEGIAPDEVVIPGYNNVNSGERNMAVMNKDAFVCNLTLFGGFAGSNPGGGNLYLENGVVSNCVLSSGLTRNHGAESGGAKVVGGLLTHCVITNSYNGNRGEGIALVQTGGRVSNCLITRNKKSWDSSRHAINLVYVSGGVIDNCTIADCWIMYNTDEGKYTETDKAVMVTGSGKAYNCAIAGIKYVGYSAEAQSVVDYTDKVPACWAGTEANFFNCVTEDTAPINESCHIATADAMFADYANGDYRSGLKLKNKGISAIEGVAVPSVDLAGKPRRSGASIDVGCYEAQPLPGMRIFVR